jgi:hypothetical protein
VGDWAIFDGTAWQQVDNTDAVVSVNGFTGAVSLTTSNISEGTNLYYTDTRSRGALSAGTGISYSSSTGVITNSAPDQTVSLTASTGISTSGTYPNFTITNTAPDRTVSLTGAGTTSISGTYPNFTITSNDQYVGTVTSVGITSSAAALTITNTPITSSGNIGVNFSGNGGQYVAGDGSLVTFPTVVTQAQNLVTEVYNETGATLTKGTVVYINGGHGNLPTITKAIATGDATSAQTYGMVRADITNMNNGFVTVIGNLENMDTQAYADGTQLYLSSTTAGAYTSVKQYAPAHLVYVGIVVRSHPTQGVIEVRIQNGFEMDELHNVSAQSPNNGDILKYVTSTSLWTSVAGSTTNISEGTNLYYTDARARGAISLTTTGNNGASTYNSTTGVLNVPTYTLAGLGGINLTSLSATSPLLYNNTTGVFSIQQASGSQAGFLSAADWTTFNSKQSALTNPVTGTGTTNYLPKFTGASTLGNSLIFDNGTSVGINTSTLTSGIPFSINVATGNNCNIAFQENSSDKWYLRNITSSNAFSFYSVAGSSEVMRLTSSGNVGIGTSSPSELLSLYQNNGNDLRLLIQQGGNGLASALNLVGNNDAGSAYNAIVSRTGSNTAMWQIGGGGVANTMVMYTGGSERMRITSGGVLLFKGVSTTTNAEFDLENDNSAVYFYASQTAGITKDIRFFRGGSSSLESMRITSGGVIAMKQTTTYGSETLEITSTISGSNQYGILVSGNAGTYGQYAMRFHNTGVSVVGSITFNTTSTAFNTSSDYRLKEDYKEIKGIEKVSAIKVYDFKWKNDNSRMDGVIAHELAEILPYAVHGEKDAVEEDGTIIPQGVDYSKIVPVLIKAIQELSAKLSALENK